MEATRFTMRRDGLICLALAVAVLAVFGQLHGSDFILLDDGVHVSDNEQVQQGLSLDSFLSAFTYTYGLGLWIPLSTMSHMLDCTLFGLNPGAHHVVNVLFHLANTILLFLVLRLMGGGSWRSAFVAALFAVHPTHVEPVAWISSRKDVLSTFFWLLTMIAYLRYALRPRALWYVTALACFCLGLLAKPIVVTLVGVLFLLDYWPLGRMDDFALRSIQFWRRNSKVLVEKIPFVILAGATLLITVMSEKASGSLPPLKYLSITDRVFTACLNYFTYVTMMVWPINLAVYYPHPMAAPPLWKALGALLVLLGITIAVVLRRRAQRYLLFGWLWYLGTLVPLIGLVQAGGHVTADRYTYVPLIGLFIMLAWGCSDLAAMRPSLKFPLTGLASVAVILCGVGAWRQTGHWRNSLSLFTHGAAVTEDNAFIHNLIGLVRIGEGNARASIPHFQVAVRVNPGDMEAAHNLGVAFLRSGAYEQAGAVFSVGLRVKPDDVRFSANLGDVLFRQGKMEEAVEHLSRAVELEAQSSKVYLELGTAYGFLGDWQRAAHNFDEAFRLNPGKDNTHFILAMSCLADGEVERARSHLDTTLRLNPEHLVANKVLRSLRPTRPARDEQDAAGQAPAHSEP